MKQSANAKCACGSGKKFKRCCGGMRKSFTEPHKFGPGCEAPCPKPGDERCAQCQFRPRPRGSAMSKVLCAAAMAMAPSR